MINGTNVGIRYFLMGITVFVKKMLPEKFVEKLHVSVLRKNPHARKLMLLNKSGITR
jgi:hypothetical protein